LTRLSVISPRAADDVLDLLQRFRPLLRPARLVVGEKLDLFQRRHAARQLGKIEILTKQLGAAKLQLAAEQAKPKPEPCPEKAEEPNPAVKSWLEGQVQTVETLKIKPNLKFDDGTPYDANAVKFNVARHQTTPSSQEYAVLSQLLGDITVVDPLTVKFTLSIPYADLPAVTAGYQAMIVSESTIDTITTKPVGTGPFRFVEYRPGDQLVVEKNLDYFIAGVPKLDRAILRIIPEPTTALAGLESGGHHASMMFAASVSPATACMSASSRPAA